MWNKQSHNAIERGPWTHVTPLGAWYFLEWLVGTNSRERWHFKARGNMVNKGNEDGSTRAKKGSHLNLVLHFSPCMYLPQHSCTHIFRTLSYTVLIWNVPFPFDELLLILQTQLHCHVLSSWHCSILSRINHPIHFLATSYFLLESPCATH
jgi:hypothetical protein